MAMVKKTLMVLLGIVLMVVGGSQLLPSHWSVTRSIVIDAAPARITPLLVDLKDGWHSWSTFDFEDPNIVYTYGTPAPGVGNTRKWVSKQMGNGDQTITRVDAQGVAYVLNMPDYHVFLDCRFDYEPLSGSTKVTWTDEGDASRNPMQRIMVQFMDRMMGPTFEKSLVKLKGLAETKPVEAKGRLH
jgi:hypothetical protein